MKTEVVSGETTPKQIDWSKAQVVQSMSGNIILTNGDHALRISYDEFSGTVLASSGSHEIGYFSTSWDQRSFRPITEPLTIKFIPNETI